MTGLVVGGIGAGLCYFREAEGPEFYVYDLLARRSRPARAANEPVVLVGIDEASLEQVRREKDLGWPWPRELVGRGVEELAQLGAKLVVLDVLYTDPSPVSTDDELAFVQHVQTAKNVISVGRAAEKDTLSNIPRGRWGVRLGFFKTKQASLPLAAELCATGQHPYAVSMELEGDSRGGSELWLGGLRSRAEAESALGALAAEIDLHLDAQPAVRELTAQEMSDPIEADDWITERDAVNVEGADQLAVPSYDAWQLPRPELTAAALRVGMGHQALVNPRESLEGLSDFDEVPNDDLDRPRSDLARSERLLVKKGGKLYPNVALAAALEARPGPLKISGGRFYYGDQSVPVNRRGYMYVTFPSAEAFGGGGQGYHPISFGQVLTNAQRREHQQPLDSELEKSIKGKIVVVADLADAVDQQRTLIPELPYRAADLASTLRTLLSGKAVARAGRTADARWAMALGLLGALFAFAGFRTTRSGLFTLITGLGGNALALALLFTYGVREFENGQIWHALFWPAAAFVSASLVTGWINFGEEATDRFRVIEALGRLTPEPLIDRVLLNPNLIAPERRVLTLYYADLANFTSSCESLPAKRLATLLGTYFSAMTAEVISARGHLDKFIGDAFLAFWNAPLREEKHAIVACRAALAMRDKLDKVRPALQKEYGVELHVRAGLNTGEVVVGELGALGKSSAEQTHYTAVGEAVNMTERLERANRYYGTTILAGEATYALTRESFAWRELDSWHIRQRPAPMKVYELQAEKGRLTAEQQACNGHYELGLNAFRAKEFAVAEDHFRAALRAQPSDGPSQVQLAWAQRYQREPPSVAWDGARDLSEL